MIVALTLVLNGVTSIVIAAMWHAGYRQGRRDGEREGHREGVALGARLEKSRAAGLLE